MTFPLSPAVDGPTNNVRPRSQPPVSSYYSNIGNKAGQWAKPYSRAALPTRSRSFSAAGTPDTDAWVADHAFG